MTKSHKPLSFYFKKYGFDANKKVGDTNPAVKKIVDVFNDHGFGPDSNLEWHDPTLWFEHIDHRVYMAFLDMSNFHVVDVHQFIWETVNLKQRDNLEYCYNIKIKGELLEEFDLNQTLDEFLEEIMEEDDINFKNSFYYIISWYGKTILGCSIFDDGLTI